LQTKSRLIFASDERNARGRIMSRRQFEDGGQRGARVLWIEVDVTTQQSVMRQHGPAQIEFTSDRTAKTVFQMLRDNLTEDNLLGEILRPDRDRVFSGAAGEVG
jgi:hypothetical protein